MALIGGINVAPRKVMGHAGAFILPGESDARTKIKQFQDVGVGIVNHPSQLGNAMKLLLGKSGRADSGPTISRAYERRNIHTRIRPRIKKQSFQLEQRRNLYLHEDQAMDLLRVRGINAAVYSGTGRKRVSDHSLLVSTA